MFAVHDVARRRREACPRACSGRCGYSNSHTGYELADGYIYTDNRARSFPSRLLRYYLYARGGYAERHPSAPAADKDTLGCNQEEAKMPRRHIWERLVVERTDERSVKTAAEQICLLFSPHLSSHYVFNFRI